MSPAAPPGAAPPRSTVNDTFVTVVGNVVDSPRRVSLENGAVTNFRMASTARRYDAARQEFVDASTFWVDVECWNGLSGNVSASISKGDPVIVQGALSTNSWESENGRRSAPRIRAFAVGPNLARGTSVFKRDKSGRSAEPADPTAPGPQSPDDGAAETFPSSDLDLRAGRDYEDDAEALHGMNLADPPVEPAYV
jgi:single-strand DNA-binding protein